MTAPPLERAITDKIMRYLKGLDSGWFYKVHGGSMGTAGVPDIVGCYRGRFMAIEVKRPLLGRLTPLQASTIAKIVRAGGIAGVVTNVEDVKKMIAGGERGLTVKDFLRQLSRMDSRINALIERQAHYMDLATRSCAVYRDSPGGGSRRASSVEEYASKIVDLGREINRRIDEYVDTTREIEGVIDQVRDDRYRDILRWRYINGWNWEKIARETHYDRVTVWRLHGRALQAVDEIRK